MDDVFRWQLGDLWVGLLQGRREGGGHKVEPLLPSVSVLSVVEGKPFSVVAGLELQSLEELHGALGDVTFRNCCRTTRALRKGSSASISEWTNHFEEALI